MNRDIEFRGKGLDGKWIVSQSYYRSNSGNIFLKNSSSLWCQVITDSMGQFTGLCDANGARVFEGDILREQRNEGRKGVVTYNKQVAAFCIMDGNSFYWLNEGDPNRSSQLVYTSIIGNIHDNPQLLEANP